MHSADICAGTVAANAEEVVEVPSGDDAIALLEARGIRLENVELERGLGNEPTPEEIFEMLVADELRATSAEDKLRVRLKRLGANPDMISHPFTTAALEDLAGERPLAVASRFATTQWAHSAADKTKLISMLEQQVGVLTSELEDLCDTLARRAANGSDARGECLGGIETLEEGGGLAHDSGGHAVERHERAGRIRT